jgi:hypothetical protein
MTARTYPLRLTGAQLRVLHEALAIVQNDPTWAETTATDDRDWAHLCRAAEAITAGWRSASRAESH